ncbi:MAG: nucleotidyl transferase AbiEii/AbiGii toxin family protein [Planctomycetaceae bacterium]|nr:nucleotidyl transferase AbiEii/AbiGii toxin family protein [Planctomycetaceae bacterium]
MNPNDSNRWKSQVLDEIFIALAASKQLNGVLVFKGARVLNMRLAGGRQSLDLDSNLATQFVQQYPDREEQRDFLKREITQAVRRYFEAQDVVKFELTSVEFKKKQRENHPMGWDAFDVKLKVNDLRKHVPNLPAIEIDIAAPEELKPTSVSTIEIGGHHVHAYTLERIAGEKLRAFLSSLPAYRAKVEKPGEAVRAKDLYDIGRIYRVNGLEPSNFWQSAGEEFRIACRSRYIDCLGLTTFQEQWEVTRKTYTEATIPKDIAFEEAEATLIAIVKFFETNEIVPFAFPLPQSSAG